MKKFIKSKIRSKNKTEDDKKVLFLFVLIIFLSFKSINYKKGGKNEKTKSLCVCHKQE